MKLKEWRWVQDIEQGGLAKALGVSQATVSKVERDGVASEAFRKAFKKVYGASAYHKIDEFKP
jgi:DNA-binding XRE family transcriptional regulator